VFWEIRMGRRSANSSFEMAAFVNGMTEFVKLFFDNVYSLEMHKVLYISFAQKMNSLFVFTEFSNSKGGHHGKAHTPSLPCVRAKLEGTVGVDKDIVGEASMSSDANLNVSKIIKLKKIKLCSQIPLEPCLPATAFLSWASSP
jgi:hypothetical protein